MQNLLFANLFRNAEAAKLLDWGFANYSLYTYTPSDPWIIKLLGSKDSFINCSAEGFSVLVPKGTASKVTVETELPESVSAPISAGDAVGKLVFKLQDEQIGEVNIISSDTATRVTFGELFFIMLQRFILW